MFRLLNAIGNNALVFSFSVYFLGFLSLSFIGEENKSVRIATTLAVLFVLLVKIAYINKFYLKNKLSAIFLVYICSLLPSLIFSEMIFMSVFKILDLIIIFLLMADSVESFFIKGLRLTFFHFILYYFIFQCIIFMGGYFFDPHALRQDFLQKGINFLTSNYPKIHSNTVGTFGGVVILYSIFRIKHFAQKYLLNYLLLGLGLSVLYLSSSRTGVLATLIGATFLIIKLFSGKQKLVLLVSIILAAVFFGNDIYQFGFKALLKMQTEETLANADNAADVLLSGRLGLWEIILEKPWNLIFGRGFGAALLTENALHNTNAHNSIVELLINAGIVATALWLVIWWRLFVYYRYIIRNKRFLPLHINYYHLSFSLLILICIKSMANITFVYFQLFDWLMVSIICLYVSTELKIKNNRKKFNHVLLSNAVCKEETEGVAER